MPVLLRSATALMIVLALLSGAEGPMPPLGPQARPLQLDDSGGRTHATTDQAQRDALIDDISALRQAVVRVNAVLKARDGHADEPAAQATATAAATARTVTSKRYGDRLRAEHDGRGGVTISAALVNQPLDAIYAELLLVAARPGQELSGPRARSKAGLAVTALPFDEVLDRLLGQAGMAWREETVGGVRQVAAVERRDETSLDDQQALRVLERTALDHTSAAGAEAQWLLARRAALAKRHLEAIAAFNLLVDEWGASKDLEVRRWVLRGIRGVADAMFELSQWRDARAVYRNYLALARGEDPEHAEVLLALADSEHRLGEAEHDPVLIDDTIQDLHLLVETWGEVPAASGVVATARLRLGELLYAAERWAEAEAHLQRVAAAGADDDVTAFRLAECAFHQGRGAQVRPVYERLAKSWAVRKADPDADPAIYATSAFRVGECWLQGETPAYVPALFSFLRARQQFVRVNLGAETLLAIARCYSEIERDDDAISTLWELLKGDALDRRDPSLQVDQLLGDLQAGLGDYPGSVRARVLFHIAQATWAKANRSRSDRAGIAAQAIGTYERVMAEDPPPGLRDAAQIGMARAALLADQGPRAEALLTGMLARTDLAARDRALAGQILGQYYRDQGRLRDAVKAFSGTAAATATGALQ